MEVLRPLSFEEANENTQEIFKNIKSQVGMLPNLYATMGVSDKLLGGFLTFSETLKSGEFTKKEYEAIALATAQANGCAYCISAHTALGKMNGFTEEETLNIRTNTMVDSKTNTLVNLVFQIIEFKGHPLEETVQDFLEVGYNKAAFAELLAAVSLNTVTNYMYHNGGFTIDFPKAQNIEELQIVELQ